MSQPASSTEKRIRSEDILSFLPALFRAVDVEKLSPSPPAFLNQAVKNGRLERIMRGYYLNLWKCRITGQWPSVEQIGCFLRQPSYVSCEWALNFHNILEQVPTVCTVVTLAPSVGRRNRVELPEVVLEYSRVKNTLFGGFEYHDGANIALPEKALLDTLYLHLTLPVPDELNRENIDPDKLRKMAAPFPETVKRKLQTLGF